MAFDELAAKAAADSASRIKAADDDALLAAEAFAFGLWPKYLEAKANDINRRINERYGSSGTATSNAAADPGIPAT
jgi:hypothetical protein